LSPIINTIFRTICKKKIQDPKAYLNSELRAAAVSILFKQGKMTWQQTMDFFKQEKEWWVRSEVIKYVQLEQVGKPSFEALINELLSDSSIDVSIVAAEFTATASLSIIKSIESINPVAQLALKKMGLIHSRRSKICPITIAIQEMLGPRVKNIIWKKILGRHYNSDVSKAIIINAFSKVDATSWVNIIDTFHDDLLDSLYTHESGNLGIYNHGNIGAILSASSSRFAAKYPKSYRTFKEIHQKRLSSIISHSINRNTGKRTSFIEFSYINRIQSKLADAYLEIWRKL